jgi:polar amino acid transport system substrate-binding protein
MVIKRLLAILLITAITTACTACGTGTKENTGETADDRPEYKVAMEPTFPPFDIINDATQELTGFDVDLMNAVAEDQGFKLEWLNMGFDGLIPALQAGNIDIVASGMDASSDRREKVDFSDTYYDTGLVVAVKGGNTAIKSIDDLTPEMKVGGQIGTTGADLTTELYEAGRIGEAKIYDGLDVAIMDLQSGAIDALINDLPVTRAYMDKKPGTIDIVGDVLKAESYAFAVQKGNTELLEKINAGLRNLKDDGTYDKIYVKWFD